VDIRGSSPAHSFAKPASFSVPWWSNELTPLVRKARRARRENRRWPSAKAWRAYLEALSAKGEAIKKATAEHFKQTVADSARGRRGIWPLAKQAKDQSHLHPRPLTIPNLVTPSSIATTPSEKAEAQKSWSIPQCHMLTSPISLMPHTPLKCCSTCQFLRRRFQVLTKSCTPSKQQAVMASHFFVLKCLGSPLVSYLQPLFQACINLSYHLTAFCHCNTVPLRKSGKGDYSAPRA
jgi:hypothetical protein